MNKIQENLKEYMVDPYTSIVSSGTFRVIDFNNLNKVLNDTEEENLILCLIEFYRMKVMRVLYIK
jgi:hypothetical protein